MLLYEFIQGFVKFQLGFKVCIFINRDCEIFISNRFDFIVFSL